MLIDYEMQFLEDLILNYIDWLAALLFGHNFSSSREARYRIAEGILEELGVNGIDLLCHLL
jgi:hypothetical protein